MWSWVFSKCKYKKKKFTRIHEIEGLNMPNGTSFVSNNCSDVIKVPCTEDDHVTIDVSVGEYKIQHNISIQMTSSYFGGTFSLPPRDTNSDIYQKQSLFIWKTQILKHILQK